VNRRNRKEAAYGEIKVLVSVDQLTTGFDVPATDTIILQMLQNQKKMNSGKRLTMMAGGIMYVFPVMVILQRVMVR
jgi:hypothetical protein